MNRLLSTVLILVFADVALAQQASTYEKKMYNIYKQSYSEEISDERWAGYLTGVGNRTYNVRPGDTLWDLSVVFFGDGLFWSKIWSYNEKLTNPHLLSVGQTIRFFTGSVEEAPGISVGPEGEPIDDASMPGAVTNNVTEPSEDVGLPQNLPEGFKEIVANSNAPEPEKITIDMEGETVGSVALDGTPNQPNQSTQPVVPRSRLYPGAPSIPPPSRLIKPVLKVLPNTFAESDSYDKSQYDEKGISFDVRPPVRVNPLFVAHSFLYGRAAQKYPNVGRIVESEDKTKLVGQNQKVYLEAKADLEIGERLTVMGLDYPFDRNGVIGDVIQYQGTVEITEKIRDSIYRGTIIKSLSGIEGNPWISREVIPTFTDDYVGRPNSTKLQVIGGGRDNVTRFYGQSDVVFIQGGTNSGVRVGDIMGVYKRRDLRYGSTTVDRAPVPIGHIKVFRAEPKLSSAFVISSDDAIVPGDETGPPILVEAVTTKSEKEDLNSIETGLDFNSDQTMEVEDDFSDEFESEIE